AAMLIDPTLSLNGAPAGTPMTHALLAMSPLIDAGTNPATLTTDERGGSFARESPAGKPDIGAFEVQVTGPAPCVVGKTVIINGGAVQRSRVTKIEVDFDQIVNLPATPGDAFLLHNANTSTDVGTITASVDNTSGKTKVTLTFSGT